MRPATFGWQGGGKRARPSRRDCLAKGPGPTPRRIGRPQLAMQALSLLQRLPNMRLVPIEADLAQLAGRFAADLGLRGADAVYVSLAHRLRVALRPWGQEQRGRSTGRNGVVTP